MASGEKADYEKRRAQRERNRCYQAAHRARIKKECSQLESRLEETNKKVLSAACTWRALRETKKKLQARLAAAGGIPAVVHVDAELNRGTGSPVEALRHGKHLQDNLAEQQVRGIPDDFLASTRLLKSAESRYVKAPATGDRHFWKSQTAASGRQTAPLHAAAVSYTVVAAYAPGHGRRSAEGFGCSTFWLPEALSACMHDTAGRLQCKPDEIQWFVQFPHSVPCGGSSSWLSSSEPDAKSTCNLSAALHYVAFWVELLFLEAEHELLEDSGRFSMNAQQHSKHNETPTQKFPAFLQWLKELPSHAHNAPDRVQVDTTDMPSESVLALVHVGCGVNERCPLVPAVKAVVNNMLRRQLSPLPRSAWTMACMCVIQWLQGVVQKISRALPNAEEVILASTQDKDISEQGKAPCGWSNNPHITQHSTHSQDFDVRTVQSMEGAKFKEALKRAKFLVLYKVLLFEVHAAMRKGPEQVEGAAMVNLENVRTRILEVSGSNEIIGRLLMRRNPQFVCCHFRESESMRGGGTDVKDEKICMKMMGSLKLSEEQSRELAQRWHSWRRHRIAQSREITSILVRCNNALPTPGDLEFALTLCHTQLIPADQCMPTGTGASPLRHEQAATLPVIASRRFSEDLQRNGRHWHGAQYRSFEDAFRAENLQDTMHDAHDAPNQGPGSDLHSEHTHLRDPMRRCSNGDSGTSAVRPSMMDIEPANRSATGSSLQFVRSASPSTPSLADVSRAVEQIPSPYDSSWRGLRMHEAMKGDGKAHRSTHAATHTSRRTETMADSARRAQLLGEAGEQVREVEDAVSSLHKLNLNDLNLLSNYLFGFHLLSPVQNARCYTGFLTSGAPKLDFLRIMQMAAHEQTWKGFPPPCDWF